MTQEALWGTTETFFEFNGTVDIPVRDLKEAMLAFGLQEREQSNGRSRRSQVQCGCC
jgi:hypothetical protein